MNPESLAHVRRRIVELFEKCSETEWPMEEMDMVSEKTLTTESYKKLFHTRRGQTRHRKRLRRPKTRPTAEMTSAMKPEIEIWRSHRQKASWLRVHIGPQ